MIKIRWIFMMVGFKTNLLVSFIAPLRSPSMIFCLMNSPNSSFHILHPAKALVEGKVVPDCVLERIFLTIKRISISFRLTFQVAAFLLKKAKLAWNQLYISLRVNCLPGDSLMAFISNCRFQQQILPNILPV